MINRIEFINPNPKATPFINSLQKDSFVRVRVHSSSYKGDEWSHSFTLNKANVYSFGIRGALQRRHDNFKDRMTHSRRLALEGLINILSREYA